MNALRDLLTLRNVICCCIALLSGTVHAQKYPIDAMLEPLLSEGSMNPELWRTEGEWRYEQAVADGTCDSILLAYALLLHATNHGAEVGVPDWEEISCEREGYFIAFGEGQRAFDQGQISAAINWYSRALEASFRPKQRADTKNNIGLCHYWNDDLERAVEWMVASKDEGMEFQSGNSLNTLASVFLSLGAFEDALEYGMAAEQQLLKELDNGMDLRSFVMYRDLILLNQTAAHLEMGNIVEARQRFELGQLQEFFPGLAPEFFHLAYILAWKFDDPALIAMHDQAFGEALREDSTGAVSRFGPALGLIDPWRSEIDGSVEEVWRELRRLSLDQLPELPTPAGDDAVALETSPVEPWVVASGFFFLVGCGTLIVVRRWQKGKLKLSVQRVPLDLALLKRAFVAQAPAHVRIEAWENLRAAQLARSPQLELNDLSQREMEVLSASIKGERPKETAERLGLRLSTVYGLRTSVRAKLGVDKEMELETWIQKTVR